MTIKRKHCLSVVKEQKRVRDSMRGYGVKKEEEVDNKSIYRDIMGACPFTMNGRCCSQSW